jgi:hypothetical protein
MLCAMMTLLLLALLADPPPSAPSFTDLSIYNGAWTIKATKTMAGPGKPDQLVNHCSPTTSFTAANKS